jgi:hypothetical protein
MSQIARNLTEPTAYSKTKSQTGAAAHRVFRNLMLNTTNGRRQERVEFSDQTRILKPIDFVGNSTRTELLRTRWHLFRHSHQA